MNLDETVQLKTQEKLNMTAPPGSPLNEKDKKGWEVKLMALWLNQVKVSPSVEIRESHKGAVARKATLLPPTRGGHTLEHDPPKTWSPSVLSLQRTASPPARTAAPAAGHIPVCVARASRAPAVRRWPRSRCTSVKEAPWDAFIPAPTPSRETNRGEGPSERQAIDSTKVQTPRPATTRQPV